MKKIAFCTVAAALSLSTAAFAADAAAPAASPMASPAAKSEMKAEKPAAGGMEMPKAGEEDKKLGMFFAHGGSWTGTVPAGAMGPDSKEMKTHGKATCSSLYGGLAYTCDVQDTMGKMTWKGHMITGWDHGSKSYKSLVVDNMGTLSTFTGTMSDDGKKFSLTSDQELNMNGQMMKDRLTWDMSSGKMMFTDEHEMNGEWKTFETAEMKGMGAAKTHATSEKKNTAGTDKPATK